MRFVLATALIALCASAALADDDVDRARAAMAIARAKAGTRFGRQTNCYEDVTQAKAAATLKNQPLLLWVGLNCTEHQAFREAMNDCVNCHASELDGDAGPALFVLQDGKTSKRLAPQEISVKAAREMITPAKKKACGCLLGEQCGCGKACDCGPATGWKDPKKKPAGTGWVWDASQHTWRPEGDGWTWDAKGEHWRRAPVMSSVATPRYLGAPANCSA